MTSMRIDGDKSAKVWTERLRKLVEAAEADGVAFLAAQGGTVHIKDSVLVYKEGRAFRVHLELWSEE